jgi:1,4-alpha-glucan branching enzyme
MGLLAAGLVGVGVIAGGFAMNRDGRSVDQSRIGVAPQLPVSDTVVRFVLVAPQAEQVSLVGDFNGWDATQTPMTRAPSNGVWTVTLPLAVGRHVYSFLVDGKWSVDPNAPLAPDDGFGHANSVKIVRRGSAL